MPISTGFGLGQGANDLIGRGAAGVLSKPFDVKQLFEAIVLAGLARGSN